LISFNFSKKSLLKLPFFRSYCCLLSSILTVTVLLDLTDVIVTTEHFIFVFLLHFFTFLSEHFFIQLSQIASADDPRLYFCSNYNNLTNPPPGLFWYAHFCLSFSYSQLFLSVPDCLFGTYIHNGSSFHLPPSLGKW
jgi:hypothetical protein